MTTTTLTIAELIAKKAELEAIAAKNAAEIAAAEKAAAKAAKKAQIEEAETHAAAIAKMMHEKGITISQVSEAFHKMNEKPRAAHLSEKTIAKIAHLLKKGYPQATIADKVGCTVGQIIHLRETNSIERGEPITIGAWFSGKKGPIPESVQKELNEMIAAELAQFEQ